jgi:hypothetical protein
MLKLPVLMTPSFETASQKESRTMPDAESSIAQLLDAAYQPTEVSRHLLKVQKK